LRSFLSPRGIFRTCILAAEEDALAGEDDMLAAEDAHFYEHDKRGL
jgi:hypothetical protein